MRYNPPDITKSYLKSDARDQLINKLKSTADDIFVLGTNAWAESINNFLNVKAFIDDFSSKSSFLEKELVKIEDLNPNSIFISSNVLGRPLTALKRLLNYSENVIDYFTLFKNHSGDLLPVLWMNEFNNEFDENIDFYNSLNIELADDHSRYILNKLINFRLSFDLSWLQGFTDCQHRQYFEPFLNLKDLKCFYDIGSYDGYTSNQFILNYPNYEMIEIFEPSPKNIINIKNNLKGQKNVNINEFCAANINGTLNFSEGGSSSNISPKGNW